MSQRPRPEPVPHRIQRSRKKGFLMPAGVVYVGRPTKWGNPYVVDVERALDPEGHAALARIAVDNFRKNLTGQVDAPAFVLPFTIADVKRELRGKVLACWCQSGAPCHADVLLEIANEGEKK